VLAHTDFESNTPLVSYIVNNPNDDYDDDNNNNNNNNNMTIYKGRNLAGVTTMA